MRRRRGALRTPAFVDRMELAEDAEGRVAIFAVDEQTDSAPEPARPRRDRGRAVVRAAGRRAGAALDSQFVLPALAALLVVVLLLGMLLRR